MANTLPRFGTTRMNTVKASLTRKRPQRTVETAEFTGFARRILRALGRRVGAADVEALPDLVALEGEVHAAVRAAVTELRNRHGYSWSEIASRLGVSKQAAQQRYGGG